MSNQILTNTYNALTNVLLEETAKVFKEWLAQSDAPDAVKERFNDATDLVEDDELGCIVLVTVNWIRENDAKNLAAAIEHLAKSSEEPTS